MRSGIGRPWVGSGIVVLAGVLAGAAAAQEPALSREELSRCATQMQTLRAESTRLNTYNAQLDEQRIVINRRRAALDSERAGLDADDLAAGLEFRQRNKQHHEQALAFNAEIEQIKRDINAVNQLKNDYDGGCAQRSYRRSDLDSLPEAARHAMRTGLDGVQVPYLDPATPLTPRP